MVARDVREEQRNVRHPAEHAEEQRPRRPGGVQADEGDDVEGGVEGEEGEEGDGLCASGGGGGLATGEGKGGKGAYLIFPYQCPRDWVRNSTMMAMRMTHAAPWAQPFMPRRMLESEEEEEEELWARRVGVAVVGEGMGLSRGWWMRLREVSSSCS